MAWSRNWRKLTKDRLLSGFSLIASLAAVQTDLCKASIEKKAEWRIPSLISSLNPMKWKLNQLLPFSINQQKFHSSQEWDSWKFHLSVKQNYDQMPTYTNLEEQRICDWRLMVTFVPLSGEKCPISRIWAKVYTASPGPAGKFNKMAQAQGFPSVELKLEFDAGTINASPIKALKHLDTIFTVMCPGLIYTFCLYGFLTSVEERR